MALSPCGSFKLSKLMCLKYYRAESEGWKDHANCDDCVERHVDVLNPFHTCSHVPDECSCKLCRHQPPSLADSSRHVLFNYTLHLDRFKLTDEKTYCQYVYAVRSSQVPQDNLLQRETLTIRIAFRHDINSPFKYHRDCPGVGPWGSQSERTYVSDDEIIQDLITHKDHFWCHHCEKGLFPNSCPEHTEEGDEEEDVDEVHEEEGEE